MCQYMNTNVIGLSLVLNAETDEYMEQSQVVGFKIVVHPHDAMPFPEDEGVIVSPGFATSIAVSKLDIRRTAAPYGRCYNYNKEENRAVNMYAQEFDVSYTDKCSWNHYSVGTHLDDVGQWRPGHRLADRWVDDGPCLARLGDSVCESGCYVSLHPQDAVQCLKQLRDDFDNGVFSCGGVCLPACEETIFETEVSMGVWPSAASVYKVQKELKNIPPEMSSGGLKNAAKVDIYFKQLNYEKITAYPAYDWSRVLGDLGGQLGLWLGFSLLTAMELLELVLGIARRLIMKLVGARSPPRVNSISVAEYRR
ncbi:hypothetical protein BaRGS_00005463 [Batillaria attramentaria]|uniref:Uncharacterized protein n=1 Tax=Batillaria attramentaria TaxID=370345 RepID=A0ABD0LUY9_9CAEN